MQDNNVVNLFRGRSIEVAEQTPALPDLPTDDDVGHFESLVSDLSFAEGDEAVAEALRHIAHWLTLWKF